MAALRDPRARGVEVWAEQLERFVVGEAGRVGQCGEQVLVSGYAADVLGWEGSAAVEDREHVVGAAGLDTVRVSKRRRSGSRKAG